MAESGRCFQYMWADAGLAGLSRLTALNPARWSKLMKLNELIQELDHLSSSRPLRLHMTSQEEQLTREFDSVTETLTWLKEHFPREAAEPLTTRPTPLGGWSLFGSCMTTSAEEPELEVVPPLEPNEDTEEEPQECSPSSSSTAPEECPLEGDVKVQYMWADARLLPIKAIQELSKHNPARWSRNYGPGELAEELDSMQTMRPVLLSLTTTSGQLQRRFHSTTAAAQWLRVSCGRDMRRLDEERLCVICLTAPRSVMLMPCRHAVLCEQCLEVLMERTPSSCPVCRQRIQNHARGHFVDDYVELVRALEMRMERSQTAAYEGMYNHIRPLMVTGALLASGAAACFVVCPPAAPALLAGAGLVGYLPWFATTVANFEEEALGQPQRIFTEEDFANPLALATKGVVLLVAAPVALTVFFIPYGLYAGVLRPLGRLLGHGLVRGACAFHIYVLRPLPGLLRMLLDGTVALGNLLGDVLGVTAEAIYDWILAPSWAGLCWTGAKLGAAGRWLYAHGLAPLGRALGRCGVALAQGMEVVFHQGLVPLARGAATAAEQFYSWVLAPTARVSWEGLKMLGRALSVAAEHTYGYVLRPLGGCLYSIAYKSTTGLWNYVLVPAAHVSWEGLKMLGRALSVAAEQTYGYLLQPLGGAMLAMVYYSAVGLWDFGNYVLVPAARATWEGLKQLGGALVMVAEQTYGYVLRPLAGGLYSYVFCPVGHAVSALAHGLAQAISYAWTSTVQGVSWLATSSYQYVLLPLASAVAELGRASYSYVLLPCGRAGRKLCAFLVEVTTSTGQTIYFHVLCPAGRLSLATAEALRQLIVQGGQTVRVACEGLRRAFN